MPPRRRLTPEERRDELLDVGERLFVTAGFDDVRLTDIAVAAGVSRALMYHYFPTKTHFFGALWERAHATLRAAAPLTGTEPVRAQISRALDGYFDFYARHPALVAVANRSPIAAEPAVRAPVATQLGAMCDRILDACGAHGHPRVVAAAGLAGWIAFVREAGLAWLLDAAITRDEAAALCLSALDGAMAGLLDLDAAPEPAASGPPGRRR